MSGGMQFVKASKKTAKLRLALVGPAGSGKTFTALSIGCHMGDRVAVIDTERQSASLYADRFEFDVLELQKPEPEAYVAALRAAAEQGYGVVIVDSLSHEWQELLERVDTISEGSKYKGNSFRAWGDKRVHGAHRDLIDAVLTYPGHVIATMRTKTAYEVQKDERTGKSAPVKIGLAPVQRDGVDYEFSLVLDMSEGGTATVSKTRCADLEGQTIRRPGKALADLLLGWLNAGPAQPDPLPPTPDAQAEARKALAARAAKLPGSPSRGLVIRDLANPHLSPDMFAEAAAWVAAQEAELAELRRQGESLKRPTEPTAGAAPTSPPPKSPAILTSPAPMSLGAGGVGASTPEQDAAEVEAAVERAKERRAALAKQAAEGSLRAQLEQAQMAGIVPPKEPIPDPGAQPARRRTQRGKAVTPEGVAEELAQAMDPTARLRQVTGDGEAW